MTQRWAVQWYSYTRDNGVDCHFMWNGAAPLLFRTRRECREYIAKEYGYIATRPDLRAEPHGWRVPRAVRVEVILAAQHGGRP